MRFDQQHNAAVYAAVRRFNPDLTPREFALANPEHDSICYGDPECWDRHEQWERDHPDGEISAEEQKSMDQYDTDRHYFEATQAEQWDPEADGLCKVCGYNELNDDTRKTGICEHCTPHHSYCFPNGMLMVFNVHGEQISGYQGRIEENLQRLLDDYPNVIAEVATYDGSSPTPIRAVRNE